MGWRGDFRAVLGGGGRAVVMRDGTGCGLLRLGQDGPAAGSEAAKGGREAVAGQQEAKYEPGEGEAEHVEIGL